MEIRGGGRRRKKRKPCSRGEWSRRGDKGERERREGKFKTEFEEHPPSLQTAISSQYQPLDIPSSTSSVDQHGRQNGR